MSVYYYLRVAHAALIGEAPPAVTVIRGAFAGAALAVAVVSVFWLGLFPAGFTAAVQQAAASLR